MQSQNSIFKIDREVAAEIAVLHSGCMRREERNHHGRRSGAGETKSTEGGAAESAEREI